MQDKNVRNQMDFFDISRSYLLITMKKGAFKTLNKKKKSLQAELKNYEKQGVPIYYGDERMDSGRLAKVMQVNEDAEYMRDYVFEDGALDEIHVHPVISDSRASKYRKKSL